MNTARRTTAVEVQYASHAGALPTEAQLEHWAVVTLEECDTSGELVVRIVDEEESADLNQAYRKKAGATNVLSFPFEAPPEVPLDLLGDLVICAPVVTRESQEQNKPPDAHFAHMVVHGTLHLLGYDHLENGEAEVMEKLEIAILGRLGYANPYQ